MREQLLGLSALCLVLVADLLPAWWSLDCSDGCGLVHRVSYTAHPLVYSDRAIAALIIGGVAGLIGLGVAYARWTVARAAVRPLAVALVVCVGLVVSLLVSQPNLDDGPPAQHTGFWFFAYPLSAVALVVAVSAVLGRLWFRRRSDPSSRTPAV